MKNIKLPKTRQESYLNKLLLCDARSLIRQRITILYFLWQGLTCRKIAELMHCDKNTVSRIRQLWKIGGVGGIITYRTTNRWDKISKRRLALERLITIPPRSLRLKFATWSLRKLKSFFIQLLDYSISITTIHRDLKILKLRYRRVKDTFLWKPIDYGIKRAWLRYEA